ncbi:hypothetical protein GCM10023185_16230 [Hymenobacter saemangeumensis]|uniref:T9SS type A sorting domain-containing protein n=1 Tax=Hymenobacter saemangeumensis TaxID=1084522 RepID=A0ABP8I9S4_9BACT
MKNCYLLVAGAVLLTQSGWAQAPLLLNSQTPGRNASAVPYSSAVTMTFSQPLASSQAGMSGVQAYAGQRTGRLAGTSTVNGNTLTFQPARNFKPGELVNLTVPAGGVQSSSGQPLSQAYVAQFRVGAVGGTGVFTGGSDASVGSSPRSLTVGDVDNDGDVDLLSADWPSGSPSTVSIRLNNGLGVYSGTQSVTPAGAANGLLLADVDADADLDLVLTIGNNNLLQVFANNGQGQFTAAGSVQVPSFPSNVVAADADGDGDLDLLVACTNGTGVVALLTNNGAGTFRVATTFAAGASNCGPVDLAAVDIDNDGDLDVLTDNSFNNTVGVALNNNGVFTPAGTTAVALGTTGLLQRRIAVADLNQDGNPDFITCNSSFSAGSISVRYGNGQGQFTGGYELTTGPQPFDLTLADVNGDGLPDLLTASNATSGVVNVRLGNGNGTFGTGTSSQGTDVVIADRPQALAAADVDGDGDLDLLTVNRPYNGSASIRLNGGSSAPLAATASTFNQLTELYPNPATGQVSVVLPAASSASSATLTLTDALGRGVRSATVALGAGGTTAGLDLGGVPAGLYTVRVQAGGLVAVRKLVVN